MKISRTILGVFVGLIISSPAANTEASAGIESRWTEGVKKLFPLMIILHLKVPVSSETIEDCP